MDVAMQELRRRSSIAKALIALGMILAIAITAAFVWWDEQREAEAAFEDLSIEETRAAVAAAGVLRARLDTEAVEGEEFCGRKVVPARASMTAEPMVTSATDESAGVPPPNAMSVPVTCEDGTKWRVSWPLSRALHEMSAIEQTGEVVLLVLPPGGDALVTTDGSKVEMLSLVDALASKATTLRLDREESVDLGLPSRSAIAGFARVDAGGGGRWGVAVVGSASRERARELRSRIRLIVSTALVGGIVLMLGNLAFRRLEKEMKFARELALSEVRQRGDERLARANRAAVMGTLAAGVAHEIGTPLGIIVGRAEQLEQRFADDERAVRSARTISEQVERIQLVVRGFLNLASGGNPSLTHVDVNELVRGATRLTQHRFEKAGVELVEVLADSPSFIQCDRRLFEHALVNLLLNACEACSRGGRVVVDVRELVDHVVFAVRDDGIGIRSEDAARVVEPFFTTKAAGQGTGLGLAITNEIVKAHRGTLKLMPDEPRGTRATIEVPLAAKRSHDAG